MVKEEPTTDDYQYCPIKFKEEDNIQTPDFGHSSDDEPLSVHKVVGSKLLSELSICIMHLELPSTTKYPTSTSSKNLERNLQGSS